MFAVGLWLIVVSVLPRVEDPWPNTIGLGLPFTLAGVWSIFAGVLYARAPQAERDRLIQKAGVYGFLLGVVLYMLSLLVQVGSSL